jgi:DNA polymerase-3 subunit epsilon
MRSALSAVQPSRIQRLTARAEAIHWAASMLEQTDAVFLDTETTGFGPHAEIVDVAVVDRHGAVLLDTLVRPVGSIPSDATAIHGIVDAMVADAPRWPEVYPLLCAALDGRAVVVYNAEFDFTMVNQMNWRCRFGQRNDAWHCAMRQYGAFSQQWNAKYGNYRWFKLADALATFGLPSGGHRALGDALACRQVVERMAASG